MNKVREILSVILQKPIPESEDFEREAVEAWDSLKHVEIIFAVEDEFGVQFTEEEMGAISSFSELVSLIEIKNAS